MEKLIEEYIKSVVDDSKFKRMLELKTIIDNKYSDLIISLKNKEASYLEAKEYSKYLDISKIQNEFVEVKTLLYSKKEVREYFKIEREIQNELNQELNDLKSSISNKFTLNNKFL